jgi:hypothetical protein
VVADAAIRLAGLALASGRINRTACRHPDGTPESDSDHTVMLGWLAPALADLTEPGLDPQLVAMYALFAVYADPSAAAASDPGRAVMWLEDTDPLPGYYQALSDADQVAGELAAGLAAGEPAALAALGGDLASLIFAWDGGPPESGGHGR